MDNRPKRPLAEMRTCEACGATGWVDSATPDAPWRSAWFCDACSQRLPADEIERLSHDVALRGVPHS